MWEPAGVALATRPGSEPAGQVFPTTAATLATPLTTALSGGIVNAAVIGAVGRVISSAAPPSTVVARRIVAATTPAGVARCIVGTATTPAAHVARAIVGTATLADVTCRIIGPAAPAPVVTRRVIGAATAPAAIITRCIVRTPAAPAAIITRCVIRTATATDMAGRIIATAALAHFAAPVVAFPIGARGGGRGKQRGSTKADQRRRGNSRK